MEKLAQASTDKCRATVTIFPEDGCVDMSVNQVPSAALSCLFIYLSVCLPVPLCFPLSVPLFVSALGSPSHRVQGVLL